VLIAFAVNPVASKVTAYWEAGSLISSAVETDSDVYILEVGLHSSFMLVEFSWFFSCLFTTRSVPSRYVS